ncbi:PLP-dependent transferase [Auriculariales sp. MPI-PUGE-AT-0066]|nr:PLP-dependent transferase [Auriculariales sp. MPI-PUGE-AT-0066]
MALHPQSEPFKDPLKRAVVKTVAPFADRGLLQRFSPTNHTTVVDFSTNDFLSLSDDKVLAQTFIDRLQRVHNEGQNAILGTGGSRLSIDAPHHLALEKRIASMWTLEGIAYPDPEDAPSATFLPSGYVANLSFWSAFPQVGDLVLHDEFIHASVRDGLRLGRTSQGAIDIKMFPHNDVSALRHLLQEDAESCSSHTVWVAVDAVYSMEGDTAPLSEIIDVLSAFPRAKLFVDEAHAIGVFDLGLTMPPHMSAERAARVFARTLTFGKAPALSGAALVAPAYARPFFIVRARPFIFSTAPCVFNVHAVECALDALQNGYTADRASKLQANVRTFLMLLQQNLEGIPSNIIRLPVSLPLPTSDADQGVLYTPIVPLLSREACQLSEFLQAQHQVCVFPIAWPAVGREAERLRICVRAGHSHKELEMLALGIAGWGRQAALRLSSPVAVGQVSRKRDAKL